MNFFKKNYYEEFWALRGMNLRVRRGERVGLIGNNGAGKSTLLKMVIGNVSPTEGSIQVNGEIQALMELGTGFHPEFTGRQNIRASLAYKGLSLTEIREKEDEIIEFSELDEFIDQPIRTYSAGMQARLSFSTATAVSPDILIVDEVLGAGDAYFAGKCVERMRKITEDAGATVLFVSHDLNSVLQLCDRIIWIHRGVIKMEGNPVDIVKEYTATVRKREELRLKARDQKKLSKAMDGDVGEKVLFRFITKTNEQPVKENKLYNLEIEKTGKIVANIDLGGPMDNGQDQSHFVIVDNEFTNWGNSKKDEHGSYRSYLNIGGKYLHAPFKFHTYDKADFLKGSLKVLADIGEDLEVQIFDEGSYRTIGSMEPMGLMEYTFHLDKDSLKDEKETKATKSRVNPEKEKNRINKIYSYGNRKVEIEDVKIYNGKNEETRILEIEDRIRVEIEYYAKEEIDSPVFVFCIYTPDGKCASQWIADEKVYGRKKINGDGRFYFLISKLYLGKGMYIASAGIFNGLSTFGTESESYCVIDRSIHFEVKQSITDTVEKGICIQPFEGKLG